MTREPKWLPADLPGETTELIGDCGYNSNRIRNSLADQGVEPCIPLLAKQKSLSHRRQKQPDHNGYFAPRNTLSGESEPPLPIRQPELDPTVPGKIRH